MKTKAIAIAGISLLVLLVVGFASIFEIRLASAQVDATSPPTFDSAPSTTTPVSTDESTSSEAIIAASSSDTTSPQASSTAGSPPTHSSAETSQSTASVAPGDTVSSTT